MASTKVLLTRGEWKAITTTDKEGSIFHNSGGNVAYLEADTLPVGFDEDTPISGRTQLGDERQYYGIASTDLLYAYAVDSDASLTVTPKGE